MREVEALFKLLFRRRGGSKETVKRLETVPQGRKEQGKSPKERLCGLSHSHFSWVGPRPFTFPMEKKVHRSPGGKQMCDMEQSLLGTHSKRRVCWGSPEKQTSSEWI